MINIPNMPHHRSRLFLATIIGGLFAVLLPDAWRFITRILIGWNIAVWTYLTMMAWIIIHSNRSSMHRISEQEDEGAITALTITSITAVLSLAAIGFELAYVENLAPRDRMGHYLLTALTIIGSWLLVGTIFTFHYAHTYYLSDKSNRAFKFPEKNDNPNYWDFLYFSFTIAAAAQTSDISIMNTGARKAVTAQAILSFVFNAAIIGLLINITAGILATH